MKFIIIVLLILLLINISNGQIQCPLDNIYLCKYWSDGFKSTNALELLKKAYVRNKINNVTLDLIQLTPGNDDGFYVVGTFCVKSNSILFSCESFALKQSYNAVLIIFILLLQLVFL